MRETTLGRWAVRLAVTVGAGALAFGMSTAAAQASVTGSSGLVSLPGSVKVVGVVHTLSSHSTEPLAVTEDFDWG